MQNQLIKIIAITLAFLCISFSLFAQEAEEDSIELPQTEEQHEDIIEVDLSSFTGEPNSIFVIEIINITPSPKSRTRPSAVMLKGEFKIGEEIKGVDKLEKYLKDKAQLLINQRVLTKSKIEYTIGEARADGKYPVHLEISVEDTWNIIALPYPKYSSNKGFDLSIRARDYNFLGSMDPLRLNLGYRYDENERNYLDIALLSSTPFRAAGFDWELKFDNYLTYRPDVIEDDTAFYYKNTTGISLDVPFKVTTFTFGIEESFVLNEENDDRYKPMYGRFQEGPYMATNLSVSWKIPTGIEVSKYGDLTYTPTVSSTFFHQFEDWPLDEFRKGPVAKFSHSLGFDKIDWMENKNYRKGLSANIKSSHSFDFFNVDNNDFVSSDYSVTGVGHFIIDNYMGVSTKLQFHHWLYRNPEYYESAGDNLRGIIDKSVHADYMLSLNLDFPLKVLSFVPSEWFKTRKLRFFDFEMHFSPIIDMALYHDPEKNIAFSFKNMLVSGGAEIIVFPAFMRSLYARLSFAWNIVEQINNPRDYYLNPYLPIVPQFPTGNNREIYFGIGHHY